MKLTLPYPPSVNRYWRIWRNRILLSEGGRKYQNDALASVLSEHGILTPITAKCNVSIVVYPPDNRRRDLDNALKATLDALTHCRVIEDDSLIDKLTIERGAVSKSNPRAEVSVEC